MMEGESAITSLLSRGSFLFNIHSTASVLSGSMQKLPMEDSKETLKREQMLEKCWGEIEKEMNDIISSQHDKVFTDLLHFILLSHKKLHNLNSTALEDGQTAPSKRLPPRLEVSTAVLITGINMPDHAVLFEHLEEKINEHSSPYVVLLRASDCNSGMKATMETILFQLMKANHNQVNSGEEATPLPSGRTSMRVLCKWYTEAVKTRRSGGVGIGGDRPPVVIVIEDLEAFAPQILQDLILSLSPHLPEFPVVLVMGVATSINLVHQILPQLATSLLCIEQLHTQHPALTLAQMIDRVLLTHLFPFHLGPQALNFLLHQFFYCNFSLADFARGLELAVMEHFSWQPLSSLCVSAAATGTRQWVGWSHGFCEAIRATPSFQRYVESQPPLQRLALLENDSKLKVKVKELVSDLDRYHQTFYPHLQCLYHLTSNLPGAPLGRKLHDVYLLCLEANIVEQDKFKTAWKLVNVLSRDEVDVRVNLCTRTLEQAIAISSGSVLQALKHTLSALASFRQEASRIEGASATGSQQATPTTTPPVPVTLETTGERKLRFHERLRQVSIRSAELSIFEIARKTLTDALLLAFTTHLQTPIHQPLHEAFYFNQMALLGKHLSPPPRAAIQAGLNTPIRYLASASGGGAKDTALCPNMPDICILYQLHLECGKLINLFDWLQAFIAVVQPDAVDTTESSSEKQEVDPVLHARFIEAVSELQHLGLIKSTQRKTDHVQRLTWGSS